MKVVVSTVSKFHTFEVVRQLEKHGVLEKLFTGRLRSKLQHENLPLSKVETFPYLQTIFEGMVRLGVRKYPLQRELNWQCHQTLDNYVARHLPPSDVFHALSYCGLKSGKRAQALGGKWVCDAANSHLVAQDEILAQEHERVGVPYKGQDPRMLEYAVASYEQADLITLPSSFVRNTFLSKGLKPEKLALLPYGVNLGFFHPVESPQDDVFRVLAVGHLSVRKGLHDLLEAFRLANIPKSKLILVGSAQPESEILLRRADGLNVDIVGAVSKNELLQFYSAADVMVLASVEEGLANVIGESLACGCPVIATEHTGGEDFFTHGVEGFITPIRSPESIAEKLVWMYEHREERLRMRQAALERVRKIGGWDSYGLKIMDEFNRLVHA